MQVAFCFVVNLAAGLFVETFDKLSHQPTGFSSERLLVLDTISIVLTTFRLSSTAQGAASTAATTYHSLRDETKACQAAEPDLLNDNVSVPNNDTWCKIDPTSGQATITLKTTASSLILGRISFTRDFTKVDVKEEAEPAL